MIGLQDVRLLGNPITDIPSDFLKVSSKLKSIAMTLKHRQCFDVIRISNESEEITFSGCQMNFKDFLGLDNLKYIELESTVLSDLELLDGNTEASTIKSTDYLNIIQNYNPTERIFADYLGNSIFPKFHVQADYNLSLPMSDLIYHSALPKVLCLHSMCILGKQIERVARTQDIGNPYGITCPTMFSKINEFKNLEVIDQTRYDYSFIFRMVHYNLKSLNLYNSNLSIMGYDIYLMFKLRELSLINVSGIDSVIKRMSRFKSLSTLDLSFNRIKEFTKLYDILLNTKLQTLNLSFNEIEYLKYVNENTSIILSNSILEVLDLSNNKLTRLAIQWVLTASLRVLNCSYNQIRNVYFNEAFLHGNGRQLSTLNLANNQHLTFMENIFDKLTSLTEIDLSETNLASYSLLENVANLCKIYLNRNSLREYVRFTCKYYSGYEIYLSGNHIQKANEVRMFYATGVLDISYNLLVDLFGSDCKDISETKILNASSNMIDNIDKSFSEIMRFLEELDLSNNPLKNLERYDIGVNAQLRKLILANSDLQIDINISIQWNVHLIDLRENRQIKRVNVITESICRHPLQLHITSLCEITTRNCPYSGEELKSYALERWFQRANNLVDLSHINCLKLHIITDAWTCEDDYKLVINLRCIENF
ncbi:hypothetical protein GJ496_008280 [Pomphorhynchus laevis]|nr:hypothetical protein GJ496_008280 [Pomphorhynchus laevis]